MVVKSRGRFEERRVSRNPVWEFRLAPGKGTWVIGHGRARRHRAASIVRDARAELIAPASDLSSLRDFPRGVANPKFDTALKLTC